MLVQIFQIEWFCEHVRRSPLCGFMDGDLFGFIDTPSEMMELNVQMFRSGPELMGFGHFQGSGVVLKNLAMYLCFCTSNIKALLLHLFE